MQPKNKTISQEITAFLRICLTLSLFMAGVIIAVFSKNPEHSPQ